MARKHSRSDKFGIRWRWLYFLGFVFYLIKGVEGIVINNENYAFLGLELGRTPFIIFHLTVSGLLFLLFIRNQKLVRKSIKEEALKNKGHK